MSCAPPPPEFLRAVAAFRALGLSMRECAESFAELSMMLREMDPDRMKVAELVARATVEVIRQRAMRPLP